MAHSEARAWWADVQHLKDGYERTDEARRRADEADLAARRAIRERRGVEAEVNSMLSAPRRTSGGPAITPRRAPEPALAPRRGQHAGGDPMPRAAQHAEGSPRHAQFADADLAPRHAQFAEQELVPRHAQFAEQELVPRHAQFAEQELVPRHAQFAEQELVPRHAQFAEQELVPRHAQFADADLLPRHVQFADPDLVPGDQPAAQPLRRARVKGSGTPGRKTIQIRGQAVPAPFVPRPLDAERRRPPRRAIERVGGRPDRVAMWALLMGLLLILVAIGTADGPAVVALTLY